MPLKSSFRCRHWRLALCTLVGVTSLHALTLGEPRVLSEPGQPLVAELPLRDLGAVKPDQLRVRMAAQAAWQAAGMPYPVDVERHEISLSTSNGEPVVLLRNPQAVHADVLDLLIELQWPQGRLQREIGRAHV